MCTADATPEMISTVTKANGDKVVWEQGVNIARNSQSKITKPFLAAMEALRREWVRNIVNKVNIEPELILTGVAALDWAGWGETIMGGWNKGTVQVLESSTRGSLELSGFEFVEIKKQEVIWSIDEKTNQVNLWVENRGAQFITGMTTSTRSTIEKILIEGVQQGLPVREIAKRVEMVIGLTARDANAVLRRRSLLQTQGTKTAQIDKVIKRYREKLIKSRSVTVARTELMAARNQGTVNAWRIAQAQGVAPLDAKKEWVMFDGCPICASIVDAGPVDLNAQFYSSESGFYYDAPPAHPRCVCSVALQ